MKINKKQLLILQEGILLDDLTNYSDFEKKILKSLHKRYKDISIYDLTVHEIAEDLHEKWGLAIDDAYKMSKVYNYKRDALFSENIHSFDIKNSEILDKNFDKIIRNYISTLTDDEIGELVDKINNKYELFLWSGYQSFTIYGRNNIKTFTVNNAVKFTNNKGEYLDKCNIKIKYKTSEDETGELGTYEFELPEKLDNNSIMEWVKSMVEFVKDILSRTAF
jgi:hypothetical protein